MDRRNYLGQLPIKDNLWGQYEYDDPTTIVMDSNRYMSRWMDKSQGMGLTSVYASDFSSGVDGWNGVNSVVSGNIDGVSDGATSFDNCIKFYANNATEIHQIVQSFSLVTLNSIYNISFNIYIPSGQTNCNGFIFRNTGIAFNANSFTVKKVIDASNYGTIVGTSCQNCAGYWLTVSMDVNNISSSTQLGFFQFKNNSIVWQGSGLSTDDIIYVTNIKIYKVSGNHLVQTTGASQPQWGSDGVTFDGVNDYMRTAIISTLNQPFSIYFLCNIISWEDLDQIYSLNSGSMGILQTGSSPNLSMRSTSAITNNNILNKKDSILTGIYNGSISLFYQDNKIITIGDIGTSGMDRVNLAARGSIENYGNIKAKCLLIYSSAHTYSQQQLMSNYLRRRFNIPF